MTSKVTVDSGEPVTFLGDFSKKLVTNTFFNLLGRSWSVLVTLLLTPYILKHLTVEVFGIWVIFSVFASWFSLLDPGLGAAFVKFISVYHTRGDYDSINKAVFSGLVFYTLLGALLIAGGLAAEKLLFGFLDIRGESAAYLFVLIACAVTNISAMFLSVFRGFQRMDKSNSIEIGMIVLNAAGTVFFLQMKLGLYGLALNALICSCVSLLISWWAVQRVLGISIRPHFDGKMLNEMFGYGAKMWVSRLGSQICFQMDKVIIAMFQGVGAVSFYEVGARLAAFMRNVPLVMISALIPATSELDARNDRAKILRTYALASRYVTLVTVGLVAYVVLEADSALALWLGTGFEQSVFIVHVLAIGYGANVLGGAASQTGAGIGRPDFDMRSTALLCTINPILSLLLVRKFGAPGAAAGTCLALIIAAAYLLVTFHRNYVESSAWMMFREIYLRPVVTGALAAIAVTGFHHLLPAVELLSQTRYLIPVKMTVDLVIFCSVYFILLIALKQITAIDWKNFVSLISFGFEFLRHPFRERVKIYR